MTCETIRERMLEADLAELRGVGETSIARHVRECDLCRADAMKIVTAEAALDAALDSMSKRVRPKSGSRRGAWRRRFWYPIVPFAAAAGLIGVWLRGGPADPYRTVAPAAIADEFPVVETTGNENVVVFNTDNPDIVVVWFLGGTD